MEERELFLLGAGCIALLASLAAVGVGLSGGLFLVLASFLIYQAAQYTSRRPPRMWNLASHYQPPRTQWFASIAEGDIWVPQDVDQALERLYERIVEELIVSWFRHISPDEEFIQEVRSLLRDITQDLLTRLAKHDLTELVLYDAAPLVLQHVDTFLWVKHHAQGDGDVHAVFVGFLGKNVHVSLSSRDAEAEYLEDLSQRLVPHLLRRRIGSSRLAGHLATCLLARRLLSTLLDSLCDPRNINKLLLLWFSPGQDKEYPSCSEPPVKLLFRFVHSHPVSSLSSLRVDLSHILANQEILFPFVQYLKKCGCVNLLNFCLAVEDFNKKMMTPGLSKDDLLSLHAEAKLLFNTYIRFGSSHYIRFQEEILKDIEEIVSGDYKGVERLRTTPPLFRAYEQVYNNLEDNYCPGFHLSSEYLRLSLGTRLSEARQQQSKHAGGGTRSSSKASQLHEASPDTHPTMLHTTSRSEVKENRLSQDVEARDLSAWRVSIPGLEARTEGGRSCFVFIIQVQRIDVPSSKDGQDLAWRVERQYHEFYSLQSALVQYHGLFEDAKLPPRSKLFRGKGLDVLQSKIEPFEQFLVKLLQKPNLKKSDLLFTFLTSHKEFEEAASQLGLSRLIKNVPKKLTKERGQFLAPFIDSFMTGAMPPNPRPLLSDPGEQSLSSQEINTLYEDNLSQLFPFTAQSLGPSQSFTPDGLYEIILYLAMRLFKLSDSLLRFLSSLKWLLDKTVNHLLHFFLANKLCCTLTSGRVAHLINIVEDCLFGGGVRETGPEETIHQAGQALLAFREYLPRPLRHLSEPGDFDEATRLLFHAFQDPFLNKQLVYSLLEVLLLKLFPELKTI